MWRGVGWIAATLFSCLIIYTISFAQPGNPGQPYGSTAGEKQRAVEYQKDGDRVRVNMRQLTSGTPTPVLAPKDRCYVECLDSSIQASINGGAYQPLGGGTSGCACLSTGTESECSGVGCSANAQSTTCVGFGCEANDIGGTCIGHECVVENGGSCIGEGCASSAPGGCFGSGCTQSVPGHFLIGGTGFGSTTLVGGDTETTSTPNGFFIEPQGASGTNIGGASLVLNGGMSTGSGTGGSIFLFTSPSSGSGSSPNSQTLRWAVDGATGELYDSSNRVVDPISQACITVESLADTDDNVPFYIAHRAVTVTGVACSCVGTCSTPGAFTLHDNSGNAMTITGTNPTCSTTTGAATYAAVTAGNVLTAGEQLQFDVTNSPTTNTEHILCVTYTTNRS